MRHSLRRPAIVICAALLIAATRPLPESPTPNDSGILRSFQNRDYAHAAELIDQSLLESPGDARLLYNAACARSLMGERDAAGKFLLKAAQAGFKDFSHMRRDSDLDAVRDHPMYRALVDARFAADAMLAQREVDRWRKQYGEEAYRYETDSEHRLLFITSLDDTRHALMREMLDREADHLAQNLFGSAPRRHVIVAVPTPADAARLLPDRHIHGSYSHGSGMLITVDAGSAFRHEFFHALHHNHMDQVGQQHPLWIQEGLAALYEDYDLHDDGTITFLPNERRNIAKMLARESRLIPLADFVRLTDSEFAADPARHYAQARTIFEFIASRQALSRWYAEYVRTFRDDSTGTKAMTIVFERSMANVDSDFRSWLDQQSTVIVQDTVRPNSVRKGLEPQMNTDERK